MDAFGRSTHFANTISIKYSSTNPMKTSLLNLYFGVHTNKWAIKIIDLGLKRKNSKTWMMIVIHNLEDHVVESYSWAPFSSVQSLSRVRPFATPWIAAHQASLSITNSREFTQTHVHRVSDAIQPYHPLSSPSPPAPNPSQHQSLFQWVNSWHEVE